MEPFRQKGSSMASWSTFQECTVAADDPFKSSLQLKLFLEHCDGLSRSDGGWNLIPLLWRPDVLPHSGWHISNMRQMLTSPNKYYTYVLASHTFILTFIHNVYVCLTASKNIYIFFVMHLTLHRMILWIIVTTVTINFTTNQYLYAFRKYNALTCINSLFHM